MDKAEDVVFDRLAVITHAALAWNSTIEAWGLLSLGRSEQEIRSKAAKWTSKGAEDVRIFEIKELPK